MSQLLKPVKWYKTLSTGAGRRETGCFLLEGFKAVSQVILVKPEAVAEIVAVEGCQPPHGYPVRVVNCAQFEQISAARTPQGIAAVVELPEGVSSSHLPQPPGNKVLLLEDVQDPGNVGTLIRTAAAFGFSGVILSAKCADPFSPKCVQSAAGSVLSVWLRRTEKYLDLAAGLKNSGWSLVATALDGQSDTALLKSDRLVIAMGSEACGLSKPCLELADCRFTIPIDRCKAESLNVAVSGGIVMWLAGI